MQIFLAVGVVDMGGRKKVWYLAQFNKIVWSESGLSVTEIPADTDIAFEKVGEGKQIFCFRGKAWTTSRRDVEMVFVDQLSGKNTDRPELQKLLAFVRDGDTVVVESISRFARNTKDLLNLIEKLTQKNVEFVSKKEAIDTTTPTGKFMLTIFGAVAELEREYILQRQAEGIAIAKQKGVYKGRKPIERSEFKNVVALWRSGSITAREAMKKLDLKPTTFYRKVKEAGLWAMLFSTSLDSV